MTAKGVVPPKPQAALEREWAWQAVRSGHFATARKYALHTLGRRPWSVDSWRLTYCAVRGR